MIEKALLCRIISLSKGKPCEMSNAALAARFGVTGRRITKHIADLKENGWIEVTGPRTKRYIRPTEKALALWTFSSIDGNIYRRKHLEMETSSTIDGNVLNYGWMHLPKNTENTKNTSICANADLRKRASSQQDKTETMFNEFWQAYPKKRDKARAQKSFFKIKNLPDVFSHLMKGLEQQKASADWKKDGGKYIPLPSTWLNGERWEDELPIQAQPPAQGSVSVWDMPELTPEEERRQDEEAKALLERLNRAN